MYWFQIFKLSVSTFFFTELSAQFDNGNFHGTSSNRHLIPPGPPAHPRPLLTVRLVHFPMNDAYQIRLERGRYVPLPTKPIPSITTENGYAVAVVQDNGMVCGIYDQKYRRCKLDMISDKLKYMTKNEIDNFPIDYVYRHSSSIVCLIPHAHCHPWQPL